jgi:hypothetical protein
MGKERNIEMNEMVVHSGSNVEAYRAGAEFGREHEARNALTQVAK